MLSDEPKSDGSVALAWAEVAEPASRPTPTHQCPRFIPARAGNTTAAHRRSCASPVHPRPRGEHQRTHRRPPRFNGSSPPARGTLVRRVLAGGVDRFIPARAGNTHKARKGLHISPVHPRPRGEHTNNRQASAERFGFIPARAGNTRPLALPSGRTAVHPRPRGGTRDAQFAAPQSSRFIPARAGNTPQTSKPRAPPAVHPRPRGEHAGVAGTVRAFTGSSPPARGTLREPNPKQRRTRFIPARAGNTGTGATIRPHRSVHPRPRGEHMDRAQDELESAGSSPPARGILTRMR